MNPTTISSGGGRRVSERERMREIYEFSTCRGGKGGGSGVEWRQ